MINSYRIIQLLRNLQNMPITKVSDTLGIDANLYTEMEEGRAPIFKHTLSRIIDILDVTPEFFNDLRIGKIDDKEIIRLFRKGYDNNT